MGCEKQTSLCEERLALWKVIIAGPFEGSCGQRF